MKIREYESIEEAAASVGRTRYELNNNINVKDAIKIPELSNELITTFLLPKDNGEFGLFLVICISKGFNKYIVWYPYEEQLKIFPGIINKYKEIDNHNKKFWRGKNGIKN